MRIFRSTLAAAATALVALGLVATPAGADGAHAVTASSPTTRQAHPAAAQRGSTTISIAPANRGIVQRDQDLELSLTVTNDTDADLPRATRTSTSSVR